MLKFISRRDDFRHLFLRQVSRPHANHVVPRALVEVIIRELATNRKSFPVAMK